MSYRPAIDVDEDLVTDGPHLRDAVRVTVVIEREPGTERVAHLELDGDEADHLIAALQDARAAYRKEVDRADRDADGEACRGDQAYDRMRDEQLEAMRLK